MKNYDKITELYCTLLREIIDFQSVQFAIFKFFCAAAQKKGDPLQNKLITQLERYNKSNHQILETLGKAIEKLLITNATQIMKMTEQHPNARMLDQNIAAIITATEQKINELRSLKEQMQKKLSELQKMPLSN